MTGAGWRTWLSTWGRPLFFAIWVLTLAIAIAAPLVGAYDSYQRREEIGKPAAMVGLRLNGTPGNIIVGAPIGERAGSAGIATGQRLVSVGGVAVRPDESLEEVAARLNGPEGSLVSVRTRAPDGTERDHRLIRSPEHLRQAYAGAGITEEARFWLFVVVGVLPLWLLTAAGLLLYTRRSRSRLSGFMSLTMLMLAAGTLAAGGAYSFLGLIKLGLIINVIASLSLVLVIMLFPSGRLEGRAGWRLFERAIFLVMFGQLIDALIPFLPEQLSGYAFVATFVGAVTLLGSRYRNIAGTAERQKIRWALFGFAIASIFLIVGFVFQALSFATSGAGAIWFPLLSHTCFALSLIAVAGGLFISLLRYRLYDADAVIGRSAAFGLLTIVLLGIFAGSQKAIEALGAELFGEGLGRLAGALGAAIAAVMIVPLHHRAHNWAEKRFQKQLVKLRRGLPVLLSGIRETAGLKRVAEVILHAVGDGVRASRAALLVGGSVVGAQGVNVTDVAAWQDGWTPTTRDGLDCDRDDPLFPMRVPLEADGHGPVGWLLLGPRPDGSFYGKDERAALAEVADPIAQALEIVRIRQSERAEREDVLTALKREVAELREEMLRLSNRDQSGRLGFRG